MKTKAQAKVAWRKAATDRLWQKYGVEAIGIDDALEAGYANGKTGVQTAEDIAAWRGLEVVQSWKARAR